MSIYVESAVKKFRVCFGSLEFLDSIGVFWGCFKPSLGLFFKNQFGSGLFCVLNRVGYFVKKCLVFNIPLCMAFSKGMGGRLKCHICNGQPIWGGKPFWRCSPP
jgi:hypothetical protein